MAGQARSRTGARQRAMRFLTHDLWLIEVGTLPGLRAFLTKALRVVLIAAREFIGDRCLQQAAALTYLTIFSLPALLALVFSMAKGLNAFERLKTGPIDGFMQHAFPEEAGAGAVRIREVVDQIFSYVESADLGLLGVFGVLFLLYAAIKMLSSVESSFNAIWGVNRSRTLVRKLTDYLAIVTVGPIMLLVGTAFTGLLHSERLRGIVGESAPPAITAAVPLVSICMGMALVLLTLPNTRVRVVPALVGGVVAGLAWQLAQVGFVHFQLGLTRMNAVFSSFAAVPLLLSWIYLSWVTLFVGAEVCFAIQNVDAITGIARTGKVDQRYREALAVRLAARVARCFLAGRPAPSAVDLASELGIAPRVVTGTLESLVEHGLLAATHESQAEGYLPARDPARIHVVDLVRALRQRPNAGAPPTTNALDARLDGLLGELEEAVSTSPANLSLRAIAEEDAAAEEALAAERRADGQDSSEDSTRAAGDPELA